MGVVSVALPRTHLSLHQQKSPPHRGGPSHFNSV